MADDPRVSLPALSGHSTHRSLPKHLLTPSNPRSSSRLSEVLDRCLTLKHDLGCTLRTLQTDRNEGRISLEKCREELDTPRQLRWKSGIKYREIQEKIRQKEVEQMLQNLVPSLQTPRETSIFIRKNRLKTSQLSAEKAKPLQINARMIGAFLLAEWLSKPRDFGKNTQKSHKSHKSVETDEMEQFWKSEIEKYDKQRTDRLIKPEKAPKMGKLMRENAWELDGDLSPLQMYVQNSVRRMRGEEIYTSMRKNRLEAKMRKIQPSEEVKTLSLKYLPKGFHKEVREVKTVQKPGSLVALLQANRRRKNLSL